jgi:hypothetical protein
MNNKRGQVTIFIIIGILIVAGVVLFFTLRGQVTDEEDKGSSVSGEINPTSYMKTCVEDKVEETIFVLSRKGGYMNHPLNINFMFTNEGKYWNITYLCYTDKDEKCNIICPSVIGNLESEIKKEVEEEITSCFNGLVSSAEDNGYEIVEEEYNGFETDLKENRLVFDIKGKLILKKGESVERNENFNIEFSTKLYNLGMVAQDIVNSKSSSGNFDIVEYSIDNPEYKIETETRTRTKIYTLTYRETEEKFRFAIKGK